MQDLSVHMYGHVERDFSSESQQSKSSIMMA